MTGDTPDDLEKRRAANERVILDAVAASLAERFAPPPYDARFTMPGTPSAPFAPAAAPPKETRMSDNGNGIFPALRADVDNLKSQYHELRSEIETKFSGLSAEIRGMVTTFETRIERAKPDVSRYFNVASILVTVALFGIGGFAAYVKGNIEGNVTDLKGAIRDINTAIPVQNKSTMEVISELAKTTAQNFKDQTAEIKAATSTAIPRPELEYRLTTEREATLSLSRTVAENVVPRTEFEKRLDTIAEDITALKENTLKRADLDGRFGDFTKRLDLISNRVEILQQNSAGTAVLQEQLREAQAQIKELRDRAFTSVK